MTDCLDCGKKYITGYYCWDCQDEYMDRKMKEIQQIVWQLWSGIHRARIEEGE